MSTRIIIEKDGERYACDGITIDIQNKSILYVSDGTSNAMASYVTLPPVERTDNSEVIANLEAENAKLKRTIDILFRDIGLDECGDCVKCADDLDFSCPYAGDPDGCNNRGCGRIKRLLTKEKVIGGEE